MSGPITGLPAASPRHKVQIFGRRTSGPRGGRKEGPQGVRKPPLRCIDVERSSDRTDVLERSHSHVSCVPLRSTSWAVRWSSCSWSSTLSRFTSSTGPWTAATPAPTSSRPAASKPSPPSVEAGGAFPLRSPYRSHVVFLFLRLMGPFNDFLKTVTFLTAVDN